MSRHNFHVEESGVRFRVRVSVEVDERPGPSIDDLVVATLRQRPLTKRELMTELALSEATIRRALSRLLPGRAVIVEQSRGGRGKETIYGLP